MAMTATKANWAGLATAGTVLVTALIARLTGIVEAPAESAIGEAVIAFAMAGASYISGFIVTWLAPANQPKA